MRTLAEITCPCIAVAALNAVAGSPGTALAFVLLGAMSAAWGLGEMLGGLPRERKVSS